MDEARLPHAMRRVALNLVRDRLVDRLENRGRACERNLPPTVLLRELATAFQELAEW